MDDEYVKTVLDKWCLGEMVREAEKAALIEFLFYRVKRLEIKIKKLEEK